MSNSRKSIYGNIVRILCTIAILAMVLVSITVYHASISGLLLFLVYFLFFINIPGAFVLKQFNLKIRNYSSQLLLSLFIGWSMIVAEFFISSLLHNTVVPYAIGPILSLLYFIEIIRNKTTAITDKRVSLSAIPVAMYIAFTLIMLYIFLRTQFIYMDPNVATSIYVSTDKAYQMGLVNSLSHEYPLLNPWISGRIVHYHIFTQILYAVPVKLLGLSSSFVVMTCGPYLTTYSLSLAFYSLFRTYSKRPDRAGLYTLSIVLSHMFIARSLTSSYFFRILFVNDNYGGFGVAAALAWLILLKICIDNADDNRINTSSCILLSIVMMVVTGIKAPIALVLVGGLIGTWLLGVVMKERPLREIIPVAVITAAFFAVYKIILAGSGSSESNGESIFGFGHLDGLCFWKGDLIDFLVQHSVPGVLRLAIIMLIFMMVFLSAYLLPFVVGYIRELILVIKKEKSFDFSRIVIYAVALVGLIMSLILKYSGHSEIYFALLLTGLAPLISFWFFEDIAEGNSAPWMNRIAAICRCVFFIVLILTSISFTMANVNQLPSAIKHSDASSQFNKYRSISADEYEAMLWIRDNTSEDSLIATHMHANISPKNYSYDNRWVNCHFLYSVFSDRKYYHEGSGFSLSDNEWIIRKKKIETNARLYDANNSSRGQLARKLGVSYVVLTKSFLDSRDLSNDDYSLCFSNDAIDIYKVTD